MDFMGYRRPDGRVGTRNYVGVLSTVVCANEVADDIARQVDGAVSFTHHQGCCQTPIDIARVTDTLVGLGSNPNLAAVLLVSLGCESTAVDAVVARLRGTGKPVEVIGLQDIGGAARTRAEGVLIVQDMVAQASKLRPEPCGIEHIVLGMKCGSSDTTQGLSATPTIGVASDTIVAAGGISILGEITEFIGAEHIVARHAATPEVAAQILSLVDRMETRAKAVGCDMRGGQPTGGNIKGGLTTIEEKSLGAIAKGGTAPIRAVYEYGQRPDVKGLVVMDSPGREPEILTGLAAAGCNVIVFATGRGAPQGFPFVPVIKLTGNERTWTHLRDHIDMSVAGIIDGTESLPAAGQRLVERILAVASGERTRAEITGYSRAMDIYVTGPVI
ncbi:UxaA family hydrolase [Rhodoplanes sp. TEM]|uniref:UxaA family hydrolase n=1 Tax=Rhodoplanes tepidamans TaxID=200616 RepID=A0ABT5JC89_RHOTP|nr:MULTISPECIES: UxaA family hydrolase [Rhodoplanes]MDC7786889.1 UxaA family hydrolase [Rhodoplanes tepidamans]MDC7987209.1 UxaA family hydrolase [Rhodoplanes sp. TEM]MDQ0355415.1 altronate dehydratase large subunit [Rhodoplanes tepidamans]